MGIRSFSLVTHASFSTCTVAAFAPLKQARVSTVLDMASINSVKAREILDSRGNPTVEVGN